MDSVGPGSSIKSCKSQTVLPSVTVIVDGIPWGDEGIINCVLCFGGCSLFGAEVMYTQVARTRHDPPHVKALASSLWAAIRAHQRRLTLDHNSLVGANNIHRIRGPERGTKEAELTGIYDPWWRNEQWRYELYYHDSVWGKIKSALPGAGTGIVLFGLYWMYDKMFGEEEHAH